jgi:hypothetical protein
LRSPRRRRPLAPTLTLRSSFVRRYNADLTVSYPFFVTGGRKVVAPGIVFEPGMKVRHPSMLFAKKFAHLIKEFLYVWETTRDRQSKDMLSGKIRSLWIKNSIFKRWAGNVFERNRRKAFLLKKARIRTTVLLQNGTSVDVCVSPLVTGNEVIALALKKRKMVSKSVNKRNKEFRLVFQNGIIDERRTLFDAGVKERSTMKLVYPLRITDAAQEYKRMAAL